MKRNARACRTAAGDPCGTSCPLCECRHLLDAATKRCRSAAVWSNEADHRYYRYLSYPLWEVSGAVT